MKIKSIYISAFGSLKDYTLDFTDGFQVIYGENEAGKTTVCEFIKSRFYGTGKRAAGQIMSIREKYTPWDGTPAGGRVFFEHGGNGYCLERQFRKSDAGDKVTLTNTATGKTEPCASDIGAGLFGMSVGAFCRSVFIGNTPAVTPDEAATGEINQKLSNAALTGEDSVSYRQVLNRIEDARYKLISKSGKTGSQVADVAELTRLEEELAGTDSAMKEKARIVKAIEETEKKINEMGKEAATVQEVLDRVKDIENAQKLKEYIELKDELDSVTKELTLPSGDVADDMFLKKFDFAFSKLDRIEEKVTSLKDDLDGLKRAAAGREGSSPDAIRAKIDEEKAKKEALEKQESEKEAEVSALEKEVQEAAAAAEKAQNMRKAVNLPVTVAGIIAAVIGAALYFPVKSVPLSVAVAALGVVAIILGFIIRPLDTAAKEAAQKALDSKKTGLSAAKAELTVIRGEKNNAEARIENLGVSLNFGVNDEQKMKDTEKLLFEETARFEEEKTKALDFFRLPRDTDVKALRRQTQELSEKAENQKQIKLRLNYLSRDLGNITYEQAREKLAQTGARGESADTETAVKAAEKIREAISGLQSEKARLETELKTGFRGLSDPEDLRRDIALLKEKIAAKTDYYEAAGVAHEVLEESFMTARKSFGGTLESETLENFKKLTGGAYGAIGVSTDFDISVEKSGVFGTHELEYLSRGTKDQAYLALRLALAKLLSGEETLPLILDDALSQYDDGRFSAAMAFLKDYSAGGQSILFTCHNFVCEAAKKENVTVTAL